MAICPKCAGPLVKRNRDGIKVYECPRHGFVRKVITPYLGKILSTALPSTPKEAPTNG